MATKKTMPPAMKARMEKMIDKGRPEAKETPKMKADEKRKGLK